MMNVVAIKTIAGLICALAAITEVSSTCTYCDFSSGSCSWTSVAFQVYPPYSPADTSLYYPYFFSSAPTYDFIWIQDRAGSVDIDTVFDVPSTSTVFSFDYFYDTVKPPGIEYLHVLLVKSPIIKILISTITVTGNTWRHIDQPCDNTNDYCCGGILEVPCSGTLEIAAYMNTAPGEALMAIDNIGTCGSVIPTTTTDRPTLPPPTPATDCCTFDRDVCGFTTVPPNQWYWSPLLSPPVYVPPHDGYYIWSDNVGSSLLSGYITGVTSSTSFSTDYYISDPRVTVEIYFNTVFLGYLNYGTTGTWSPNVVLCNSCCGGLSTCSGQVKLLIKSGVAPFVVALDDTQVGGGCHDSFPCCYFKDSYMCDFTNLLPNLIDWQWSAANKPKNYVPPSGTADGLYVYFETVNYGGSAFKATLRSPMLTIASSTQFEGFFYVKTPLASAATDILNLNFYDLATGTSTTMDFVKDTSDYWLPATLSCVSTHGDCCHGAPSCTGYIDFEANVDDIGGTLIYAIETFNSATTCSFPGLMMTSGSGNSSYIPLLPVH